MSDMYFSNDAGYATARVRVATPDEAAERARRDGRARANLEAFALEWHPSDIEAAGQAFAFLRDALGLGPCARRTRKPGICSGCGTDIPLWKASPSTGDTSGYCSKTCQKQHQTYTTK